MSQDSDFHLKKKVFSLFPLYFKIGINIPITHENHKKYYNRFCGGIILKSQFIKNISLGCKTICTPCISLTTLLNHSLIQKKTPGYNQFRLGSSQYLIENIKCACSSILQFVRFVVSLCLAFQCMYLFCSDFILLHYFA